MKDFRELRSIWYHSKSSENKKSGSKNQVTCNRFKVFGNKHKIVCGGKHLVTNIRLKVSGNKY